MRHTHCYKCGIDLTATEDARIPFKHPTGTRYFCPRCASHEGGYTWKNSYRPETNKPAKAGFTISKEFEIPNSALASISAAQTTAYMESRGWIGTSDSTVWKEFKSPIYSGLQSISKVLKAFDETLKIADWRGDTHYGTHTNVGHADLDVEAINIIRQWRETLLTPLQNIMDNDPRGMIYIYGRTWTFYANKIGEYDSHGWAHDHGCFINLQHDTHIEFRLNHYTSFEQDNRCNKYAIETVGALVDFTKAVKNNRQTLMGSELANANRAHAQKTAEKFRLVWLKHTTPLRVAHDDAVAD